MTRKSKAILSVIVFASVFLAVFIIKEKKICFLIHSAKAKRPYFIEYKGYGQVKKVIYTARAELDKLEYKPGDKIKISIDLYLADDIKDQVAGFKALYAALTAERVFDAKGDERRFHNMGMSTLLTPTGMPIENTEESVPHSKVSNSYKGLFELYTENDLPGDFRSGKSKHAHFDLEGNIPADLPDGYYRFEIDLGYKTESAALRWELYPLYMRAVESRKDVNSKEVFRISLLDVAVRQHHFSPVFRSGKPAQPRMIWALFCNEYSYEARGVVAEEDKNKFALNLNETGPALPIYPMRNPDGSYRAYNLEPDFPMINQTAVFMQDQNYYAAQFNPEYFVEFESSSEIYDPIPLDYTSGQVKVVVHTPSGAVTQLGNLPFAEKTSTGAGTNSGKFRYVFKEYGEYTIECSGWINDVWGQKYLGGGKYKIWIAEPLSFSTSTKPGMPFPAGAPFSTRVSIHPAVPADIDFKVWLYRHSDPKDVKYMEYKGKATQFGYHFAIPEKKMILDTPGEYRSEIVARYVDGAGRLWMGAAINGSIVYDPNSKIKVHGDPVDYIALKHDVPRFHMGLEFMSSALMSRSMGCSILTRRFPNNMEDVLKMAVPNAGRDQSVLLVLTFEDTSGYWEKKILDAFPTFQDRLATSCPEGLEVLNRHFKWIDYIPMAVPDCLISLSPAIVTINKKRENLPLMILSKDMVQPHNYPEKINTMCYFYAAAIKPGMVVRRQVGDSTHTNGYWQTFPNSFSRRLGYVASGDVPTDTYRLVGGVVLKDFETGKYDSAPYHGALVFTESGYDDDRVVAPLSEPLVEVAGRKMYALIGASPEPGTIYQTGDLISNGGIVFPVTSMDFIWNIRKPDGEIIAQRGKSNELGLAFPPKSVIPAEQPGVYRVTQKLGKDGELGGVVGTADDSFNIYVVEKNSPYKIALEGPPVTPIKDLVKGVTIRGQIPSGVSEAKLYYTAITPGCVLAEGAVPLDKEGRFGYDFRPLDQSVHCPGFDVVVGETGITTMGHVVLFSFFLQGKDAGGKIVTAARQASIVHGRLITMELGALDPGMLSHLNRPEERPNLAMMAHPEMVKNFYSGETGKKEAATLLQDFTSYRNSFVPAAPRDYRNKETLKNLCVSCHSGEDVFSMDLDRGQWRRVLNFHRKKDAILLTGAEYEAAIETLQTEFGAFWPHDEKTKKQFLAGDEIYRKNCLVCHDEKRVLYGSKYSSGWQNIIGSMNLNMVKPLSDSDNNMLLKYLSWRQAKESDLSDIPVPADEKKWQTERHMFQRVCFTCHSLPFMTKKPWPQNSTGFVLPHVTEKAPYLATKDELIAISKYLDYRKTYGRP